MIIRTHAVPGRWLVHAYYTVSPFAPDGSGRILTGGADLQHNVGEVLILSADGEVLDRFGDGPSEASFFHTGRWQTWSPSAEFAYYTQGMLSRPQVVRREVATGSELVVDGDLEGAPPADAPLLSGLLGMLHAAGAGDGSYDADRSPVPFADRSAHGLFRYRFSPPSATLVRSVAEVLADHPAVDRLLAADRETLARLGTPLSLMIYCVRWSPNGRRLLFYFGNHLAAHSRGEPKIGYVMTASADLTDVRLAVDLSFGVPGVHWSWQPDNERLIGYGPDPEAPEQLCLAEVIFDGSGYRKLSDHASGGHPSASPTDPDLLVSDAVTSTGGEVIFLSRRTGTVIATEPLPKFRGAKPPRGRTPLSTDHHPVFHPSGDRVLANALPDDHAVLVEIAVPR
ncbi:hypothetical protein [Microlunatus sp. GCM10028923]|uniref:hypothetical protein n=1 Tax=Microlunatus sp. GCM10028923 TaxID=3273400 RepID=UPI00360F1E21